jgi:acetyl esterase/lipase
MHVTGSPLGGCSPMRCRSGLARDPLARDRRRLLAALGALAAVPLSGCTRLLLGGANLLDHGDPAVANAAYGPERRQRYDVFRPTGEATTPRSAVVFVHGGSWENGDKDLYAWVGQGLAALGHVGILINYRLVPQVQFPAYVDDLSRALATVRPLLTGWGADPQRLFLMGHSAGAHIAALTALDPRYLAAHGLSPQILAGFIGLSGPYDFLPLNTRLLRRQFSGQSREHDSQPVNFVTKAAPRTLLAHGRADRVVFPRNSESLAARLTAAGAATELMLIDGGHGATVREFAKPYRDDSALVQRVQAFIARG